MKGSFVSAFLAVSIGLIGKSSCDSECQTDKEWAQKVAEPLSDFSALLYRAISIGDPEKNVIFSPVSVALTLSLVEEGAGNQTRSQIRYLLVKRGSSDSDTGNIYQALHHHLKPRPDGKVKLSIVNGLYHQPTIDLKQGYLNVIKRCFDATVDKCDFRSDAEACRRRINGFVAENTAQKITELFKSGSIDPDTKSVLANAVYFKASWKNAFTRIQNASFYQFGRDEPQTVEYLVDQDQYLYSQTNGILIAGIPYRGGEFYMYIILPKKRDGMADAEKHLTGAELRHLFNRTSFQEVLLKIPKFKIRTTVDLKPILTTLGLNDMFNNAANFSRMTDAKLRVDSASHEAFISVNENGTEAAAATGFGMRSLSASLPPVPFVVNHPFLYAIVHQPTNAIIFAGKVLHVEQ